jgi:hypothetical protein
MHKDVLIRFRSNHSILGKKNKTMKSSNLLLIALVISFGHACAAAQDEPANSGLAKAPEKRQPARSAI